MQRASAETADDLVFAPLTPDSDDKRLVGFVRATEKQRDAAERARLLYVAATRARERLHLVCELAAGKAQPSSNTLLSLMWPTVAGAFREAHAQTANIDTAAPITPVLRRLVNVRAPPLASGTSANVERAEPDEARPEYAWVGEAAVHIGSVVHRYLQRIADDGLSAWSPTRVATCARAFALELELLGVEPGELTEATSRVGAALTAALTEEHGRWVLGPHAESRSELRLTIRRTTGLEHLRLDRTFVADGTRWIVDFKTSRHQGGDLEAFLESEVERYRTQLESYSSAMAEIDSRPIKVALYFPLLSALRVWEPAL